MLSLYVLPGNEKLVSVSPFCMKVVLLLDLLGVEHEVKAGNPRTAPRGKLPYIDDDGQIVADSANIMAHVTKKTGRSLYSPTNAAERAIGHAAVRIAEDSFYWMVVYAQFFDDHGWAHHRPDVEKALPAALRWALIHVVRRSLKQQLHSVGLSRMPASEVYARGAADLDALLGFLGDKDFLLGDEPSVHDLSPWSMLACLYAATLPEPVQKLLDDRPGIRAWVDRLEARRLQRASAPASAPAGAAAAG